MPSRLTSFGRSQSPPRSFSVSRPGQPSSPYPDQELRSPTTFGAPGTPHSIHSTTGLLPQSSDLPPPQQYNPQPQQPPPRREPLCERYLLLLVFSWAAAVSGWVVWIYVTKERWCKEKAW
ncbi:hypothetical protein AC579_9475 [Pseudocercospora musae]|uniref:Uncharacterized protein n=1 Tax=Pseudocercospora musae TaxID=113226 RepID=A0A139I9D9_9PEZI|nr:hypothetical protein AC579_9475 [Pseudocercospora musae]